MALADLGEGEKQAIGLASNLGEDVLLLVDDRVGRRVKDIPQTAHGLVIFS